MIFLLIPAAFVQLPTEIFEGLSPRNQLKVVCAGVWHNLVLVLVSVSFILSAPVILFPFYSSTDGVVIARIVNVSVIEWIRWHQIDRISFFLIFSFFFSFFHFFFSTLSQIFLEKVDCE